MAEAEEYVNFTAEEIERSTLEMSADGERQLVKRECRVMIIGRTGSGKSSLANKLLGRPDRKFTDLNNAEQEALERKPEDPFFVTSNVSVTRTCQFGTAVRNGITLTVVDTPGLFDTGSEMNNRHVKIELTRGLFLVGGEPHAFIIVVELGRVTEEVQKAFQTCIELFGTSRVIVAFSRGELLEEDNIKSVEEAAEPARNSKLKAILGVVRETGRYVVVTKNPKKLEAEVDLLMEKINEVSDELRNPWSNPKLKELAEEYQRLVEKKMRETKCSQEDAAIAVRIEIANWDERKELLVKLAGCVALFIASSNVGL